jgi:hypothetical protein
MRGTGIVLWSAASRHLVPNYFLRGYRRSAPIPENTCLSDPVRIVRAIVFAVTRGGFEFWRELRF